MELDKSYYLSLSQEELLDIKANIDKEQFPERYRLISQILSEKIPRELDDKAQQETNEAPKVFKEKIANNISWKPVEYDFIPISTVMIDANKNVVAFKSEPVSNIIGILLVMIPASIMLLNDLEGEYAPYLVAIMTIALFFIPGIKLWSGGKIEFSKIDNSVRLKNYKYETKQISKVELTSDSGFQLLSFDYNELNFFTYNDTGNSPGNVYQLNLVVDQELRINLCCARNDSDILAYGRILSSELELPLWSGIEVPKKNEELS